MPEIDIAALTKVIADANAEIERLHKKVVRYHQDYLDAYRDACKFVGSNGMGPKCAQFLQDMHMTLEMRAYEDSEEAEREV